MDFFFRVIFDLFVENLTGGVPLEAMKSCRVLLEKFGYVNIWNLNFLSPLRDYVLFFEKEIIS